MSFAVRTPIEIGDEEAKKPSEDYTAGKVDTFPNGEAAMPPVGQTGPASVTEPPDGRENAPLKPQLSAKLARSVSNRTTRPQRCNRVNY